MGPSARSVIRLGALCQRDGFSERRLPIRLNRGRDASQYPLAAFEVAQGDYAEFAHHYMAIGKKLAAIARILPRVDHDQRFSGDASQRLDLSTLATGGGGGDSPPNPNFGRCRDQDPPPPLEGLSREADQGWGEGSRPHRPLPPTLIRFAAQALKGRGEALFLASAVKQAPA